MDSEFYLQARREWDERYGDLVLEKRNSDRIRRPDAPDPDSRPRNDLGQRQDEGHPVHRRSGQAGYAITIRARSARRARRQPSSG
jgi:hypothetical protein